MSYSNYQLPPNFGYPAPHEQQYPQQQYYQQQYPVQSPAYPQQQAAPPAFVQPNSPPAFAQPSSPPAYVQPSSPPPSMYSSSGMSTLSTPSAGSSNDLVPMYSQPPVQQRPRAVSVSPPSSKPMNSQFRSGSNDDLQAIVASQERAMADAKKEQRARSLSPMMTRKDYTVPKNSTTKKPLSDGIHPEKYDMQKSRKQRTVAGATSGAIVGGLLAGPAFPVGMALGAAAGGYASNKMHKLGERRRQRRHEQRNFQKAAKNTVVAKSDSIVYV